LDVSRLADDVIFNDLQPRMVCSVCGLHSVWSSRRRRQPVMAASWL